MTATALVGAEVELSLVPMAGRTANPNTQPLGSLRFGTSPCSLFRGGEVYGTRLGEDR